MSAWSWDWSTAGWAAWILFFAVWETLALRSGVPVHPLTAHLQPIFTIAPIMWYLTFGLWLWMFTHFLVEPFGSFAGLVSFLSGGSA